MSSYLEAANPVYPEYPENHMGRVSTHFPSDYDDGHINDHNFCIDLFFFKLNLVEKLVHYRICLHTFFKLQLMAPSVTWKKNIIDLQPIWKRPKCHRGNGWKCRNITECQCSCSVVRCVDISINFRAYCGWNKILTPMVWWGQKLNDTGPSTKFRHKFTSERSSWTHHQRTYKLKKTH